MKNKLEKLERFIKIENEKVELLLEEHNKTMKIVESLLRKAPYKNNKEFMQELQTSSEWAFHCPSQFMNEEPIIYDGEGRRAYHNSRVCYYKIKNFLSNGKAS